ncbi:MAG TPA: alpha/beta hydrolase [Acetobacteraceae bacterium]
MRSGWLTLPDGRIETGWWGPNPDDAPTIVLLHEGLGCVALWRDVPERLAAATGLGVFAYSRFGYGQSDPVSLPRPMTYMHHEGQVVLPQVLAAAGIRDAVLVGHSDGGSIAAIYAGITEGERLEADAPFPHRHGRAWPDHPRLAVLAERKGVDGRPPPTTTEGAVKPPEGWSKVGHDGRTAPRLHALVTIAAHFFVEDLNIASIRQIRNTYDTGELRPRLARYHRDPDIAFHGWNGAWLDPRFRDFDITGFLPTIRVPTLGLQGADDPYGTAAQLEIMRTRMIAPVDTRLIGDARHTPHLEAKEATLDAITGFISATIRQHVP